MEAAGLSRDNRTDLRGPEEYTRYLNGLGITDVVGWDCDPGALKGFAGGYDPSVPDDHEAIAKAVVPYVDFLKKAGSKYLICRPMASWWKCAPVTDEKIITAAECWNKVGKVSAEYGVKILLEPEWLCAADRKSVV